MSNVSVWASPGAAMAQGALDAVTFEQQWQTAQIARMEYERMMRLVGPRAYGSVGVDVPMGTTPSTAPAPKESNRVEVKPLPDVSLPPHPFAGAGEGYDSTTALNSLASSAPAAPETAGYRPLHNYVEYYTPREVAARRTAAAAAIPPYVASPDVTPFSEDMPGYYPSSPRPRAYVASPDVTPFSEDPRGYYPPTSSYGVNDLLYDNARNMQIARRAFPQPSYGVNDLLYDNARNMRAAAPYYPNDPGAGYAPRGIQPLYDRYGVTPDPFAQLRMRGMDTLYRKYNVLPDPAPFTPEETGLGAYDFVAEMVKDIYMRYGIANAAYQAAGYPPGRYVGQ